MTRTVVKRGGVYETHADIKGSALEVRDLNVYYRERARGFRAKRDFTQTLFDVSFAVADGEILGLCGESGCGKSTLSKAICGIVGDFDGEIALADERPLMVFQDPFGSLNPAKRVGWLLEEPLRVDPARSWGETERRARIEEVSEQVEISRDLFDRYPHELSGGQRQRVAIACAIMRRPRFLIADEPVSALDVTIQKQVLELLRSLHESMGLSMLFISHDLRVVWQVCDRVMIMRAGRIVEQGTVRDVYARPAHEYTKSLLSAAGIS